MTDDPPPARSLGFAGSLLLSAGGLATGALPVGWRLPRPHATVGMITCYLGLALLIAAWWRLGRALPGTRALLVTLAWWAGPLALGAPLFSRDVYAYLAQGAMVHAGLDVYRQGPADLGGPLAAEVPAVWQHTPTPYGPVFLLCVAAVAALAGTHVLAGVLALRLLAVSAVAALAWLTARLGERYGVGAGRALWLGVLNPLVLLHLVAGAHNDALMLALLCAGLHLAGAQRPGAGPCLTPARHPAAGACAVRAERSAQRWSARMPAAVLLVTAAGLVKAPAAVGLAAVAALWAGRFTGPTRLPRAVTAALALAATAALAGAATAIATALTGTGYGWVGALRTPVSAGNWSVSSVLGRLAGSALATVDSAGAGAALVACRWAGLVAVAGAVGWAWWRRARLGQAQVVGVSLGALAVFGPATRPWYLLWGVIPLAVAAPAGALRRLAATASAVLAVVVLPDGYPPGRTDASLAALGLLVGLLALRFLRPVQPLGVRAWAGAPW